MSKITCNRTREKLISALNDYLKIRDKEYFCCCTDDLPYKCCYCRAKELYEQFTFKAVEIDLP